MKFRVVIEATQWYRNGDHPEDYSRRHSGMDKDIFRDFPPEERRKRGWEGDVVRYFRKPEVSGENICSHCSMKMRVHGWIDTKEGGHIVCPGDWIITGIQGERYPCKPDIFEATYEAVE